MTLLLIALIIFGILSATRHIVLKKDADDKKKTTKTNVKLQDKIYAAMKEIVDMKLKEGVSVKALFSKFGLPSENELAGSIHMRDSVETLDNLTVLLTRREMHRRGYKYSYTGKESEWQETEKRLEKFEELKRKYPWL